MGRAAVHPEFKVPASVSVSPVRSEGTRDTLPWVFIASIIIASIIVASIIVAKDHRPHSCASSQPSLILTAANGACSVP